jgi:hypothetical protein
VYRQCSSKFGYIEALGNIAYEGDDLHAKCWFRNDDYVRSCGEHLSESHKSFCGSCPKLEIVYDWNPHYDLHGLKPVMFADYMSTESTSPAWTKVSYSDGDVSYATLATADVYFKRVEDETAFGDIKATGCHIADKALYPDYDKCEDNRLYLTQATHSRFDGKKTYDGISHVGVYFVEFSGTEDIQFSGTLYRRDKVIIGFEIPFPDVLGMINFEPGSYIKNGHMHTFVHVKSHEQFKCFLDLKYAKTANQWTEKGITFEKEANIDVVQTIDQLETLIH